MSVPRPASETEHKQFLSERFAYLYLAVADDKRTLVNAPPTVPIFRAGVAGHEEQVAAVDIDSLSTAEVLPCDAGHAFTLSTVSKENPEAPSKKYRHNNEQADARGPTVYRACVYFLPPSAFSITMACHCGAIDMPLDLTSAHDHEHFAKTS